MTNTNGLSPLMQAAVGGEKQTIPGGQITQTEQGFVFSPGKGMEPIPVQDPKELITGDGSTDYLYEETENGFVIVDVANVEEGEEFEEGVPGTPSGPGAMGGVGGPMEMASPYKNYKNPQDYKVFNFGNKPTPFNKYKKGK